MSRKNQTPLAERVIRAAEAALEEQNYACPVDVMLGLGWLNPNTLRYWQQGRIPSLEEAMHVSASRLNEAMSLFSSWAHAKDLVPSDGRYLARTPQQQPLRFSKSGNEALDRAYRTHWLSNRLKPTEQRRVEEKASRPPDLVAILPLKKDWTCHRCGETGDLLMMEPAGAVCLRCAGFDDLVFVPSGNALLTRRVTARSARKLVVVRFARTRKRYERQGLLVEAAALAEVRGELGLPAEDEDD